MKLYVAAVGHDSGADKDYKAGTKEDCVRYVHEFFLGYGFEMINGKPWSSGNSSNSLTSLQAATQPDDRGFTCFGWYDTETIDGQEMISGFQHCDGQGPCAEISEST